MSSKGIEAAAAGISEVSQQGIQMIIADIHAREEVSETAAARTLNSSATSVGRFTASMGDSAWFDRILILKIVCMQKQHR